MGINGLFALIRKKYPSVIESRSLRDFAFTRVAIDVHSYIYKYKSIPSSGKMGWLNLMLKFLLSLKKNRVHAVIILEGKAPVEKNDEREKRRTEREKLVAKTQGLIDDLRKYIETGVASASLQEYSEKPLSGKFGDGGNSPIRSLLIGRSPPGQSPGQSLLGGSIDVKRVEDHIVRLKKQNVVITPADISQFTELLNHIGIPYIQSVGEAETTASFLCLSGLVDVVFSEDSDVLAYGAPYLAFGMKDETYHFIDYARLLTSMNFTREQFTDFCIMCGTDYNKNLPRVGPINSWKLISECGSIENVQLSKGWGDIGILNHVAVRDIFSLKSFQFVDATSPINKPWVVPTFQEIRTVWKAIVTGDLIAFLVRSGYNRSLFAGSYIDELWGFTEIEFVE